MAGLFKNMKVAQRAQSDPLLYEMLRDLGNAGDLLSAAFDSLVVRVDAAALGFVNVKANGAVGDGVADDTTAISKAIAAAAKMSPRGVVFFPSGTYSTTGGYDLDGLSGLQIIGSGVGSTVIRLAHATNDLFSVAATKTKNLRIGGFSVTSDTVTRTGGWVFRVNNAYNGTGGLLRSAFHNLEITKQFNGLGIQKYEFVTLNDILIWDPVGTTGVGLKFGQTTASNVNQGSEARARNVQVYANDLAGGASKLATGILIEDCDAVELEGCGVGGVYGDGLVIKANAGGHSPANHFILETVCDATDTGHSARITGGGDVAFVQFVSGWFCSAGRALGGSSVCHGLFIDLTGSLTMGKVVGSNFFNNNGNGLRVDSPAHISLVASANTFNYCGLAAVAGYRASVYVNVNTNYLAPVITGCYETNSSLYSIESSATANKLMVVGNYLVTAASYGTPPQVNASNGS